jgi:hypothetical protein
MNRYAYLAAVLALGIVGLVVVYAVQARGTRRDSEKRPWHHYLLLWPIVLDADKQRRNGRFLTAREWIGWTIVGLVIVLAVIFT